MGLGFLGFGLAYMLWSVPMARLTEIPLPTPTARIDFAAIYGGVQLGFGAFLLRCARRPDGLAVGLSAATFVLAAIGTVRLLSLVLASGPPDWVIYVALAMELGGAALCWWAGRVAFRGNH